MSITEEDHDLGDCEKWWGYTCEECKQEYLERATEWKMEDSYCDKWK